MAALNCNILEWVYSYRLKKRLDIPVIKLDTTDLINTAYLITDCKQVDCYTPLLPCDTTIVKLCNMAYTGTINQGMTGNGDAQYIFDIDTADIVNGTAPYHYDWTWDETKFELEGSSEDSSGIVLNRTYWPAFNNSQIKVKIIDARGCIFTKTVNFNFPSLCGDTSMGGFAGIGGGINTLENNNLYGTNPATIVMAFDETSISNMTPPLTISNWTYQGVGLVPVDFVQNRNYNIFRRTQYAFCNACISITALVTDVHGCTRLVGNTVTAGEMHCVDNTRSYNVSAITNAGFTINLVNFNPAWTYDVSVVVNGNPDNYTILNQNIANIPVTGLVADTHYVVRVRIKCPDANVTDMGRYHLMTLP